MSIEQENVIDFVAIDRASGDLHLTITEHLPWDHNEGNHLVLLQNKLNAYLRFIESGEAFEKMPAAKGRSIVIKLVGKFSLSEQASRFFELARCRIEEAGFRLQFTLKRPN